MTPFLKILHLEDVATDAALVEWELRKAKIQFDIKVVDNKADYVGALDYYLPDLIIADHTLPSFNSIDALKIMKEANKNIPFILVTASVSEDFVVSIMKFGANDFIVKDRIARLPNAVINAYHTHLLEKEKQKNLDDIIASQSIMNEAEQLAHFGSWELSLQSGIVKWSDECYRILGYQPNEISLTFNTYLSHVFEEDIVLVQKSLGEVFYSIAAQQIRYRVHTKDKTNKHILSRMMVIRNHNNNPISIIGFNQDVTEIIEAQEHLKQSEANLQTILTTAETAYILIDTEWQVISFNPFAETYTRLLYQKELQKNTPALSYFTENSHATISDIIRKTLSGQNMSYETNMVQEDGNTMWFHIKWFQVRDHLSAIIGLMLEISDITERKTAEMEIERISNDVIQQNTSLEQYAFIVSHNLRAPVANIMGLTSLLVGDGLTTTEKREYIEALSYTSGKLDKVVIDMNHILQISKRENEMKVRVSVKELIDDITLMIRTKIQLANAVIRYDSEPGQDMLLTIKSYIYSILYHMIVNSIKFRQPDVNPYIIITGKQVNNNFILTVKDNGKGIDINQYGSRLFGMYQKFDQESEGAGMGLCLIKTQTEALGGTISVESEINKGTIFTIQLPV